MIPLLTSPAQRLNATKGPKAGHHQQLQWHQQRNNGNKRQGPTKSKPALLKQRDLFWHLSKVVSKTETRNETDKLLPRLHILI